VIGPFASSGDPDRPKAGSVGFQNHPIRVVRVAAVSELSVSIPAITTSCDVGADASAMPSDPEARLVATRVTRSN
jgi:hypothetical protein